MDRRRLASLPILFLSFSIRPATALILIFLELELIIQVCLKVSKIDPFFLLGENKGNGPRIIPRAASRLYTGRKEFGERLTKAFLFDPLTPPTDQRTFVIIGLGGMGKSETCLKFVEAHRDEYVKVNNSLAFAEKLGTGQYSGLTLRAST